MALPDAASTGRVSPRVGAAQNRDLPAAPVACVPAVQADPVRAVDDPAARAVDDPAARAVGDPAVQAVGDPGCRDAGHRRGGDAGDGSEAICSRSTWRVTPVRMCLRLRGP